MSNEEKKLQSTNINWYPGHMHKTKRIIKENIDKIDVVYELVDARIPFSSKVRDIDEIIKNKKRIMIMTKKDLCNIDETNKWIKYYENNGYNVLLVDLNENNVINKIVELTHEITKEFQDKRINKGLNKKEICALVIGVPNVGKSTLINKLSGKKVVQAENRPGVTKSITTIKTNHNIVLYDTPGLLWPKFEDHIIALNLACTGSIKSDILNLDEVCIHILNFLYENNKNILETLYGIKNNDVLEMYETIAKKIGAFRNNEVDYDKVSKKVYNDVLGEKIKGVTFDIWK